MLALTFHIGPHRHAVDSLHVSRVVPMVALTPIDDAPPWLAGNAKLLGIDTPIIDLSALLIEKPVAKLLSTRILLYLSPKPVGFIVERMTEGVRLKPPENHEPTDPAKPWLLAILFDPLGPIHLIDPQKAMPAETLAIFLPEPR